MFERVVVEWHRNFVVELEDRVAVRAFFTDSIPDEVVFTSTARKLRSRLLDYFSGRVVDFSDFDVAYPTEFSGRVLQEVRKIPYGKVETYSSLARRLDTSPRAVGVALKKNPVPVVVPCHRVVAKNGIGGYSPGTSIKKLLLEMELKGGLHFAADVSPVLEMEAGDED